MGWWDVQVVSKHTPLSETSGLLRMTSWWPWARPTQKLLFRAHWSPVDHVDLLTSRQLCLSFERRSVCKAGSVVAMNQLLAMCAAKQSDSSILSHVLQGRIDIWTGSTIQLEQIQIHTNTWYHACSVLEAWLQPRRALMPVVAFGGYFVGLRSTLVAKPSVLETTHNPPLQVTNVSHITISSSEWLWVVWAIAPVRPEKLIPHWEGFFQE